MFFVSKLTGIVVISYKSTKIVFFVQNLTKKAVNFAYKSLKIVSFPLELTPVVIFTYKSVQFLSSNQLSEILVHLSE